MMPRHVGVIVIAQSSLAHAGVDSGFLAPGLLLQCNFGPRALQLLEGGRGHRLEPVEETRLNPDLQANVEALRQNAGIEPS